MNFFDEYEAELRAIDEAMVASGEWDRKMAAMRKKSEEDMARMIASGAIEAEEDSQDDEEEED